MLKHLIILLVLSLGVVFGSAHIHPVLISLVSAHDWVSQILLEVFSGGPIGSAIRNLLALIIIPLAVGAIPAAVYWMSKRHMFPYFMHVVWVVWLVQTTAMIMVYKTPV